MNQQTDRKILGLTNAQAKESQAKYGRNVLTPPPPQSMWKLLAEKFRDPLIKILLVALLLSFGVSAYEIWIGMGMTSLLEPIGILAAVVLATFVGFVVEVNANKKFQILNYVNDDIDVKVIRDGKVHKISRQELAVGDVTMLDAGEEVPADGLLLNSCMLCINESSLTGEPMVRKSHLQENKDSEATYPTDHIYRGTTIIEGHCTMQVTAVGDSTEYGKVYEASQIDNGVKTPLMQQLDRLGKTISWLGYGAALLLFLGRLFSYFIVYSSWDMLEFVEYMLTTIMLSVTLIVVSVPEGLPMSVTLSLALSMRKMLFNNNLVRKMHACETMGAATVICTDKTGTLTQNQMQVYKTEFYNLANQATLTDDTACQLVAESIALNTTAYLEENAQGKTSVLGNPTEGALLLWLAENGIDYLTLRKDASIVAQVPFSTERKYMATMVHSHQLGCNVLYVKGASEIISKFCSSFCGDMKFDVIREHLLGYQNKAMRTIGFAYKILSDDESPITDGVLHTHDMTFMGIAAISDPVRSDVPDAIKECVSAGIKVKIVTGDTSGTACEIARQVGIMSNNDQSATISGPEFADLSDDAAAEVAKSLKVMSRARPQDKQRLVSLLQKQGEVVAVTGDGTNDAPALNAAQVGLSMGDGTSVAKEASDITILDNSFASITKAVLWGRSLYLNIQRFVVFQLTVNVIACVVVTLGSFLGKQAPLSVTQMLWVNLVMDTFAALAMASLPATHKVMTQKPRRKGAPIITRSMWTFILGYGLLLASFLSAYYLYLKGTDDFGRFALRNILNFAHDIDSRELTKFFTAFVFVQFWNMLNARSFFSEHWAFYRIGRNKTFFAMWLVIFVGQVLISMFGGEFFKLTDLSLYETLRIATFTSIVAIIGQTVQFTKRRMRKV